MRRDIVGEAVVAVTALATIGLSSSLAADAPPPDFTLPVFPIGIAGVDAYNASMISVLDHSSAFYTQCCDDTIIAYTGETVVRDEFATGCPAPTTGPECFFAAGCVCAYRDPAGEPFEINGHYVGSIFGPQYLLYDGHPGYDYAYGSGTPLVATRAGQLCKAREDGINGTLQADTAWDAFHTFYIDHGIFPDDVGYASWYLHAGDLAGTDNAGNALQGLEVGECAPVAAGQLVATVGNTGTFAPHLHFEVRWYAAIFGPERQSKIIDPYGWQGQGEDPWARPGGNTAARSRSEPVWVPEPGAPGQACAAIATLLALVRYSRGAARLPYTIRTKSCGPRKPPPQAASNSAVGRARAT